MRLVNAFRFVLRTQRPAVAPSPQHIFQPLVTSSTAQLMEIDFNLHKTNSSYFADLDIARAHLVCTLFSRAIERVRGGTGAYVFAPSPTPSAGGKNTGQQEKKKEKPPLFGLALGAVSCSFRRELRPYQDYEMWTRLLAWDEKWLYIATHFVRAGAGAGTATGFSSLYPEQQGSGSCTEGTTAATTTNKSSRPEPEKQHIFATALSKCVFKSGRKTVAPEQMLRMSGLLPAVEGQEEGEEGQKGPAKPVVDMTLEEIEEQRLKGLETAQMLSGQYQQCLEAEFDNSGSEVLGRHTDGAGVVGVVNTLLQLARLRRSQVL
ncbi:hypothetical protein SLS62_006861 [Diatrype stigma]|uniref:Capsule polysaccharide biosynthesis protein n=1 Tax=Diatrype stigma TaxID=117547 RepID=A0AAN9UQ05_9PEZI